MDLKPLWKNDYVVGLGLKLVKLDSVAREERQIWVSLDLAGVDAYN